MSGEIRATMDKRIVDSLNTAPLTAPNAFLNIPDEPDNAETDESQFGFYVYDQDGGKRWVKSAHGAFSENMETTSNQLEG